MSMRHLRGVDEKAIVAALEGIVGTSVEQDSLYERLRLTRPPTMVPPKPPSELTVQTANQYASQLAAHSYQWYPETEKYVDSTLSRLLNTGLLTRPSLNDITFYYTKKVNLEKCIQVRQTLQQSLHALPDTDNVNMLLYLYLHKRTVSNRSYKITSELRDCTLFQAQPNASTLYILYAGLRSDAILKMITDRGVSIHPINGVIARHMLEKGATVDKVLDFLQSAGSRDTQVSNAILETILKREGFHSAWTYMTGFKPNTKSIKAFVSYFNARDQPYFSLSMVQYLGDKYGIGDMTDFYAEICRHILHKNYAKWPILAKYLYFMADGRLDSAELLRKGQQYDPFFELDLSPSELDEMAQLSKDLYWHDEPIVVLAHNSEAYQTTVRTYFR